MQSLGEILRHDDAAYLKYLSRKTQYLITRDKAEFIHRFWQHLVIEYHPQRVIPDLSPANQKTLLILMKNFAHDTRPVMQKKYQALEKKLPWVLLHPGGGYFIPYEIIKTLMPQNRYIPQGFLFQLLYTMPDAERHSLRALTARSHRSREILGSEKHPLDSALALYIWTAGNRDTRSHARKPDKVRTTTPHSIWNFLEERFPNLTDEISEWQYVMMNGRKGFYRSLTVIRGAELLKRYVASLRVLPVTSRRHRVYPAHNLKFRIPFEFLPDRTLTKLR